MHSILLLLSAALTHAAVQARTVSSGAGGHHVEPHLAGNPTDPNEVVVAGMVVSDLDPTRWRVRVFWSNDGGEH